MRAVVASCGLECGDASIQGYAQKLMGGHLFDRKSGDPGTGLGIGYVAPGHNSAHYDRADDANCVLVQIITMQLAGLPKRALY